MTIYLYIKKLYELINAANTSCKCERDCYREVLFTDLSGSKEFKIVLTGGDARLQLTEGQYVRADLYWDHFYENGEWKTEYFLLSIEPLDANQYANVNNNYYEEK